MTAVGIGPKALAQESEAASGSAGPRDQLATILYCGLGGAALGVSTLSFYGRPQDNLNNIAIGFAVGIISGATYVTYESTMRTQSSYEMRAPKPEIESELEAARPRFARGLAIPLMTHWTF